MVKALFDTSILIDFAVAELAVELRRRHGRLLAARNTRDFPAGPGSTRTTPPSTRQDSGRPRVVRRAANVVLLADNARLFATQRSL
jgi:hypothetical protein